jgi:hypothetical protein
MTYSVLLLLLLLQNRFGSALGAIFVMVIPMITTFNSTSLSLTTNARRANAPVPSLHTAGHS